jgi:predicted nucleic acid-binding protein
MSTTSNIFVDSSVLVEAVKGNRVNFFTALIGGINNRLFINETVLSEYLFYVLAMTGGASPKTLKERGDIPAIIEKNQKLVTVLLDFSFLIGGPSLMSHVPAFISKYNFLPNDAIILATCKIHNITKLASHDSDFILPCKAEGIELLREE